MCGNTTTSRSGSSGYWVIADGVSFISGMCGFPQQNQWGKGTRNA